AALSLLVLVLAVTEITGVTHWLRDQPPASDPLRSVDRSGDRGSSRIPRPTPGPPKYGDPDYTNTLGMKYKLIPAGTFTMGSSQEEIDHFVGTVSDEGYKRMLQTEGPVHAVEITKPFYMGTTEVTVGQFRRFVEANPQYQGVDDRWKGPGFEQTD